MRGVKLDLQVATSQSDLPDKQEFERWVNAALQAVQPTQDTRNVCEMTIRLVGIDEGRTLNRTYRHSDRATNVLSFPFDQIEGIEESFVGDLIVCADVVAKEAASQNKSLQSHWAHMIVHGTLHLCGFDHVKKEEAEIMEALEVLILRDLGFSNPYAVDGQSVVE